LAQRKRFWIVLPRIEDLGACQRKISDVPRGDVKIVLDRRGRDEGIDRRRQSPPHAPCGATNASPSPDDGIVQAQNAAGEDPLRPRQRLLDPCTPGIVYRQRPQSLLDFSERKYTDVHTPSRLVARPRFYDSIWLRP